MTQWIYNLPHEFSGVRAAGSRFFLGQQSERDSRS